MIILDTSKWTKSVTQLLDSETDDSNDIEVIGFDEGFDFSNFYE